MASWPDVLTKSKSEKAFTRPPKVIDTQNRYRVLTSVHVSLGNNQYLPVFVFVERVSTRELQLWMNFGSSTTHTHLN